jgi:hypothetical protein
MTRTRLIPALAGACAVAIGSTAFAVSGGGEPGGATTPRSVSDGELVRAFPVLGRAASADNRITTRNPAAQGRAARLSASSRLVHEGGGARTWVFTENDQVCLLHQEAGAGIEACSDRAEAVDEGGLLVTLPTREAGRRVVGLVPAGSSAPVVTDAAGRARQLGVREGAFVAEAAAPEKVTFTDADGRVHEHDGLNPPGPRG